MLNGCEFGGFSPILGAAVCNAGTAGGAGALGPSNVFAGTRLHGRGTATGVLFVEIAAKHVHHCEALNFIITSFLVIK